MNRLSTKSHSDSVLAGRSRHIGAVVTTGAVGASRLHVEASTVVASYSFRRSTV